MKMLAYHISDLPQAQVMAPTQSFIAEHGGEDAAIEAMRWLLPPGSTNVTIIEMDALPTSRRLRNAWRVRGPDVAEDDNSARDCVRDRVKWLRRAKLRELRDREQLDGEDVAAERSQVEAIDPTEHVRGLTPAQLRDDAIWTPPGLRRVRK